MLEQDSDYQSKEHVAILSSRKDDIKLLETTQLDCGSGLDQANAIKSLLDEWNSQESSMTLSHKSEQIELFNRAWPCVLTQLLLILVNLVEHAFY